jgi:ADP-heptose:LPS heptosyltransferase
MFWSRRPDIPELDNPDILRIRPPDGYGDHLMVSAVLEGLKAERREMRVHLAVARPEIFEGNPHVEHMVEVGRLKKAAPDVLERYLFLKARQPVERQKNPSGHLIDDMYAKIGVPLVNRPRQPRIYLTDAELAYREKELAGLPHPRVAVVPHGKRHVKLPNKIYPGEQWEELARLLVATGWTIIQLGTRKEGPLLPGAVDFMDIGYRRSAAVLRHVDLLVCHVGGLMHLGAAMGTPAVVLYGAAEHPAISGYSTNRNLYVPIECGPCWMQAVCDHHSCMRALTPAIAMAEIRAALAGDPEPKSELIRLLGP